jgi:2-iminobutanoate/2-iminopropanoate deaminase
VSLSHPESPEHPYTSVRSPDGRTAYVSGVLPYEDDGSIARDRDRAIQRVLVVLEHRLGEAGFRLDDVVKTTVYLLDLDWRPELNAAFWGSFSSPRPARTALQVSRLPGGSPIELEAVAMKVTS